MNRTEHLFFDLDHTLWDFDKNSEEALAELFIQLKLNRDIENFTDFHEAYKRINAKYWSLYNHGKVSKLEVRVNRFIEVFEVFKLDNPNERAIEISERYLSISPYKTHLFPDAHETLSYLNKRYKLHIITNGFHEVQHIKLNQSKLNSYFDLILCSEEVGVNKPNPTVFKTALDKTGAKPGQSIMIGDNLEADILGAQNCGIETIFFNPKSIPFSVNTREIRGLKELTRIL